MTKKIAKFSIAVSSFLPMFVFAQQVGGADIDSIFGKINSVLSSIVPILLTLALIYFFWGLVKYIMSAGEESARKDGKWMMIWGIIALFVMVSVWGLVATVGNITGVGSVDAPDTDLIPPSLND